MLKLVKKKQSSFSTLIIQRWLPDSARALFSLFDVFKKLSGVSRLQFNVNAML